MAEPEAGPRGADPPEPAALHCFSKGIPFIHTDREINTKKSVLLKLKWTTLDFADRPRVLKG